MYEDKRKQWEAVRLFWRGSPSGSNHMSMTSLFWHLNFKCVFGQTLNRKHLTEAMSQFGWKTDSNHYLKVTQLLKQAMGDFLWKVRFLKRTHQKLITILHIITHNKVTKGGVLATALHPKMCLKEFSCLTAISIDQINATHIWIYRSYLNERSSSETKVSWNTCAMHFSQGMLCVCVCVCLSVCAYCKLSPVNIVIYT